MRKTPDSLKEKQATQEHAMTKILIVDDNKIIRTILSSTLHAHGYETTTAHNGLEGVSLARSEFPDLILMDLMMPVMDGCQAIKQIKSDPTLKKTPIIVITAADTKDSMVHAISAGANAYIKKPWRVNDLISQIKSLITH